MIPVARAKRPASRSASARVKSAPIAFPVFDGYRESLIEWVEQLEKGRGGAIVSSLSEAHARLSRVRRSPRHLRLAEFLHHALLAIESGETGGARHILLTALAAFGWPSTFGAPVRP